MPCQEIMPAHGFLTLTNDGIKHYTNLYKMIGWRTGKKLIEYLHIKDDEIFYRKKPSRDYWPNLTLSQS